MDNPAASFYPDAGKGDRFASGHAGIWKEMRFARNMRLKCNVVCIGNPCHLNCYEKENSMLSLDNSDSDNPFERLNQLNQLLHQLDERALILSIAAFAEDSLGELIGAFMRPVSATNRLLDGFNAPLGTFSSRIQAAHALGLITKRQYSDLEHLRKIRNTFAHSWKPLSFSDPTIATHIKGISYSNIDDKFPETPLEKVRSSLPSLLVELQITAQGIRKDGLRVSVIGTGVSSGVPGTLEEQISACRRNLTEINNELAKTTGEKHEFLEMIHKRWVVKFFRVMAHAPEDRHAEIASMICEFVEGGHEKVLAIVNEYLHPKATGKLTMSATNKPL